MLQMKCPKCKSTNQEIHGEFGECQLVCECGFTGYWGADENDASIGWAYAVEDAQEEEEEMTERDMTDTQTEEEEMTQHYICNAGELAEFFDNDIHEDWGIEDDSILSDEDYVKVVYDADAGPAWICHNDSNDNVIVELDRSDADAFLAELVDRHMRAWANEATAHERRDGAVDGLVAWMVDDDEESILDIFTRNDVAEMDRIASDLAYSVEQERQRYQITGLHNATIRRACRQWLAHSRKIIVDTLTERIEEESS